MYLGTLTNHTPRLALLTSNSVKRFSLCGFSEFDAAEVWPEDEDFSEAMCPFAEEDITRSNNAVITKRLSTQRTVKELMDFFKQTLFTIFE